MSDVHVFRTGHGICGACKHCETGDFWSTSLDGKHGVMVESKGWCLLKKNKRKRWNYRKACDQIIERKTDSIIMYGTGLPGEDTLKELEEELNSISHVGKQNHSVPGQQK